MENTIVSIDYTKKTRKELVDICKTKQIKGYTGKKKNELIALITGQFDTALSNSIIPTNIIMPPNKVGRLNYIGSKFQLLDWITEIIKEKTAWSSFADKRIADLFAGTGIVSHHFRMQNASIISNDAELYSSIITHAFTRSTYTDLCKTAIMQLQSDLSENKHANTIGFITEKYSPHNGNERKFFTIENAQRIDYIRQRLEVLKTELELCDDEYKFILASIIICADAVSNVPAVYGCFLKNFKAKAMKNLCLKPIHMIELLSVNSRTYNLDVLSDELITAVNQGTDLVYLDPPYNERQYSKNYFPLNIIAKTSEQLIGEAPLKGKTGIPVDCFISPFCKKGAVVQDAFEKLFKELNSKWIFLSYNSESIVKKDKMIELMSKYGTVSVVEREYKRFKSFEYNQDIQIKEYLFCLEKFI